ncbi:unnamed protein product [Acanthoscelides obtectus]|uniref:Large ribosomal subunit protein P2 n=1 Tax=Acanthoscelides obtectus TaxID=200917 RepID=A0A9P0LT70_ACAOB|nr:unnamed protein product [Acanthoscelides obtectus]CAK1651798.1 60S acidic ribosomal protein P2 [Acanthoscelides obtectus]
MRLRGCLFASCPRGQSLSIKCGHRKDLGSVGVEADGERLKKVISELNGKSIDDLIAQGKLGVRLGEAANKEPCDNTRFKQILIFSLNDFSRFILC